MRYVLLLLLLTGCAQVWVHPNGTNERWTADNKGCEDRGLEAAKQGSHREKEIYAACMFGHGWRQRPQ